MARLERDELHGIDARATRMHGRDRQVGILVRVAVTRKMLAGREHPVLLQTVNERRAHRGDEVRILAERSHPDDGIRRIVVDVEHGSERDVHAERAPLERGDTPFLIGERSVARRADSHLVREHRPAAEIDVVGQEVSAALTERDARLVVGADDERKSAQPLHGVELDRRLDRRADGHDEAADVFARDELLDAGPAGARRRRIVAEKLRPDELRRLVARRHRGEDRVGPAVAARGRRPPRWIRASNGACAKHGDRRDRGQSVRAGAPRTHH